VIDLVEVHFTVVMDLIQVCSHIVSAIHREAMKIKFEFETHAVGSVLEATNENVRLVAGGKYFL